MNIEYKKTFNLMTNNLIDECYNMALLNLLEVN